MRCITLASRLKNAEFKCIFICKELDGNLIDYIEGAGFSVVRLPKTETFKTNEQTPYGNWLGGGWQEDAESTRRILAEFDETVDWLVVDHYALDYRWEWCIKAVVSKILVIDDLANRKHDCDALLDQNFYIRENRYKDLLPDHCKQLIGPKYALLRDEFQTAHRTNEHNEVNSVFVCFGSFDHYHLVYKSLQALVQSNIRRVIDLVVVTGRNNPDQQKIASLSREFPNVKILTSTNQFAQYLSNADIAIGAGGAITWERCFLGVPSIAVTVAENQEELARSVASVGAQLLIGDQNSISADDITCSINLLLKSRDLRKHIRKQAMELVDGKGLDRVASVFLQPEIIIREAENSDIQNIWEWRNSERIRLASLNPDRIEWDNHKQWFSAVLKDNSRILLIGEVNKQPVGVVRFDFSSQVEAEVSIFLVPEQIGKGLGSNLLRTSIAWLLRQRPKLKSVYASVKAGNDQSKKVFIKSGFVESHSNYRKHISSH